MKAAKEVAQGIAQYVDAIKLLQDVGVELKEEPTDITAGSDAAFEKK